MRTRIGTTSITLERGDITAHKADAIVNAANSGLLGGSGVDGAIHRRGGPAILEECKVIATTRGPLPPGDAVSTTAGKLFARRVLHTVGPIWQGGEEEEAETLARCYVSCLVLAEAEGLKTVAFPSISTGAYRYPLTEAAKVAMRAVVAHLKERPAVFERITWVLFNEPAFEAYAKMLGVVSTELG